MCGIFGNSGRISLRPATPASGRPSGAGHISRPKYLPGRRPEPFCNSGRLPSRFGPPHGPGAVYPRLPHSRVRSDVLSLSVVVYLILAMSSRNTGQFRRPAKRPAKRPRSRAPHRDASPPPGPSFGSPDTYTECITTTTPVNLSINPIHCPAGSSTDAQTRVRGQHGAKRA